MHVNGNYAKNVFSLSYFLLANRFVRSLCGISNYFCFDRKGKNVYCTHSFLAWKCIVKKEKHYPNHLSVAGKLLWLPAHRYSFGNCTLATIYYSHRIFTLKKIKSIYSIGQNIRFIFDFFQYKCVIIYIELLICTN